MNIKSLGVLYLIFCLSRSLESEKVAFFKKCSSSNVYCKSMLGNMYYQMKQYEKAYELLIESQGDLKGSSGYRWAPSELALGEMYALGQGVVKNREEANEHFVKCALAGNDKCISWVISISKEKLKDSQQYSAKYPNVVDHAALELLYWDTMANYGYSYDSVVSLTADGKVMHIRDEINELIKIITDQEAALKWQRNAEKERESFIVEDNFTRNLTYPSCDNQIGL